MRVSLPAACLVASCALFGCDGLAKLTGGSGASSAQSAAPPPLPAGSTCRDSDHCPRDQACVEHRCRYRVSSVTGEYLAVVGRGLYEAQDLDEAARTYQAAVAAFVRADAPTPPSIQCEAAAAILGAARTPEARESAARAADRCFRASLPGAPERKQVMQLVAKLRFDGLDATKFDAEQPAPRFFTATPSRPSTDSVEVAIDMPSHDYPGYAEIQGSLRGAEVTRAVADCFTKEWQKKHMKQLDTSFTVKYRSRMRDMGDYDVYVPSIEVIGVGDASGFDGCVAQAVTAGLGSPPKLRRSTSWEQPVSLAARLP
ncbi:MAG: hypothetical protein MJD61_01665 [Proteobacteria bacterium]|nr:hypothetical protein [Pseudomonadota bacterium]